MDAGLRRRALVVRARELVGRAVRTLVDQRMQHRQIDRRYHPPPRGAGSTVPRSRARCTQRTNVLRWMENRAATSAYVSVPVSYARTARSRSAVGYGFGMRAIDHRSILNSSEFWG